MGKYITYYDNHDSYIAPGGTYDNVSFCKEENEVHWTSGSPYLKAALKSLYDKGLIENEDHLTEEESKYILYSKDSGFVVDSSGTSVWCHSNDLLKNKYENIFNISDPNFGWNMKYRLAYFDYNDHCWKNYYIYATQKSSIIGDEYFVVIGQSNEEKTDMYEDLLQTLPV